MQVIIIPQISKKDKILNQINEVQIQIVNCCLSGKNLYNVQFLEQKIKQLKNELLLCQKPNNIQ